MAPKDLFIVAAEASGDRHAAHLVEAVRVRRPEITFRGFGGPEMRAAGCEIHEDLTGTASMVLGFLKNLRRYYGVLRRFDRLLAEAPPAAVILVDSPGLNFLLARLAKWRGIPVIYYICPQIWAWAPWRRRKVLRWCDMLMPILSFEEDLYRNPRVPVHYVGHPLADELSRLPASMGEALRSRVGAGDGSRLIAVFPGSRRKEVEVLLPCFAGLLARLELGADREILVSCYREEFRPLVEDAARQHDVRLTPVLEDARALMMACDFALVASGTAALELAYFEKPMMVLYGTTWLGHLLFRFGRVTPWIALPNILGHAVNGGEATVFEKLFYKDPNGEIIPLARALIEDGPEREAALDRLRRLKETAFQPGGVAGAADALVGFLEARVGERQT